MELHQNPLLKRLSLNQLEEALSCLYHDQHPKDELLQSLEGRDWGFLARLLSGLMSERRVSNLH